MFKKFTVVLISGMALISCSKKSSDKADDTASTSSTSPNIAASSFADLNLSSVLSIKIPNSIKGTGASALRLSGQKSFEACELRSQIREGISNITNANSMLCILEKGATITFGKKYNIDLSALSEAASSAKGDTEATTGLKLDDSVVAEGSDGSDTGSMGLPSSMQVWIDNSTAGKAVVWMCENRKPIQMFSIEGVKDGKSKGTLIMANSMSFSGFSADYKHSVSFDNGYTDASTTSISIKQLVSSSMNGADADVSRRLLTMKLIEGGISSVANSYAGSSQSYNTSFSSAGKFSSEFGSVIAKGSILDGSNQTFDFSHESTFNAANEIVNPLDYPLAFGDGGTVALTAKDVPAAPDSSFTPDSFPADAWDCSGTEDLSLKFTADSNGSSSLDSCMQSWDELSEEDCWGSVYAQGSEVEISSEEQPSADEVFDSSEDEVGGESEGE